MKLQPNTKLVMIGDSITDCGRARPVGDGSGEALGKGYVMFVDALMGATYPRQAVRIVNMGIGGDRVRDLKARWQTDVIDQKPDWLSIMIGINDVWRQFDRPKHRDMHVLPEEYETTLSELVERTRPQLKGLVLMTPFFIEPHGAEPMRAKMDHYGQIVKRVAAKNDAVLVDVQAAFDADLAAGHPASIASDRVHPNHVGHMIIARAFLSGIGFSWNGA